MLTALSLSSCIYFLDPDDIVPPPDPSALLPPVPHAHPSGLSQLDPEARILEPPVTTNPPFCRPALPQAQVNAIHRLSSHVNVLPVIARADTLTNDRLAAIKLAVRHDLASAGIGFGIFDDVEQYQHLKDALDVPVLNGDVKPYLAHPNGSASSSSATSSPTSPVTPSFLRLPYALISPDGYSHGDGVNRAPPSRHELVLQYTPQSHSHPSSYHLPPKIARGKFIRSYRWGYLDVLDHTHCDFLALRHAAFKHMQVRF